MSIPEQAQHGRIVKRTCGLPPDPWTVTPPLLSALILVQVRTSTSSSLAWKPASDTVHFGVDELPPLESSASMGGFRMAMVESEPVDGNFTYGDQERVRLKTLDMRMVILTAVVRNELFAAIAALRAAFSVLTCVTRGLSST